MNDKKPLNCLEQFFPDEQSTQHFAEHLFSCLKPSLLLTFSGDLGAGKTTFIRAMLRAAGVKSAIKSPTFSLVESYEVPGFQFHHFDLYRIHNEDELEFLGFRDYFDQKSVCCIEWPERAGRMLNAVDLHVSLSIKGAGRAMLIQAYSASGETILACLKDN